MVVKMAPTMAVIDLIVLKFIFVYEIFLILIEIEMKFVWKGPINNKPSSVQIIAWRQTGAKQLSEPMMA